MYKSLFIWLLIGMCSILVLNLLTWKSPLAAAVNFLVIIFFIAIAYIHFLRERVFLLETILAGYRQGQVGEARSPEVAVEEDDLEKA